MPKFSLSRSAADHLIQTFQTSAPPPQWSVRQIRVALRQHQLGDLTLSSLLADSLGEDDEFLADLERRCDASLRADFELEAPGAEDAELDTNAQRAADLWCHMAPYGELRDLLANFLIMGSAPATLDWDTTSYPGLWVPTLRALPTEFLRYDWPTRTWRYRTESEPTGETVITPGDGKWVLLTGGQRGWMWGRIRALALLWLGKQQAYCEWQRYCQKHGLPIFKAVVPIYRDDTEKEEFIEELAQMRSEGVIGLPQDDEGKGYDVSLLEPVALSWQTFQANLERADRKLQIMLLGGNLGAEVAKSGGNMGAAAVHADTLSELAESDAQTLGEALQYQLLGPFFARNFGITDPLLLPRPCWDPNSEDIRSWTTAQGQFATAVQTLATAGYELTNIDAVAAKFGFEVKKRPASEMQPPAPVAPGKAAPRGPSKRPAP